VGVRPALLLLTGCAPFADVAEREAGWYTPAGVAAQGIELAPLAEGAPIGHWPRVTLSPTTAGFDNRAWFLTLDEATLRMAEPEAVRARLLVEAPEAVALERGRFAEEGRRGRLSPGLHEAAQRALESRRNGPHAGEPLPVDGAVAILADVDVPWESVTVAVYSAMQAGYSSYALAGAHEGHVRGAVWSRPGPGRSMNCATPLLAQVAADGTRLSLHMGPPIIGANGQCDHLRATGAQAVLQQVVDGCAPRWAALEAELRTGKREDWACAEVWPAVEPTLNVGAALPTLNALGSPGPDVHIGPLRWPTKKRTDRCRAAVYLPMLTEPQWDFLCGLDDVRGWDALEREAAASDAPLAGLRIPRKRRVPSRDRLAELFPAFDASLPAPSGPTLGSAAEEAEDAP
jgi:hypothetical protein